MAKVPAFLRYTHGPDILRDLLIISYLYRSFFVPSVSYRSVDVSSGFRFSESSSRNKRKILRSNKSLHTENLTFFPRACELGRRNSYAKIVMLIIVSFQREKKIFASLIVEDNLWVLPCILYPD